MNNRIDYRLAAIADAIQRRKLKQISPVDPLSASLMEFESWLTGLDEQGKRELLEELNTPSGNGTSGLNLSLKDMERIIEGVKA